jgi:hypothetical protein
MEAVTANERELRRARDRRSRTSQIDIVNALRQRGQNLVSLSTPQSADLTDTAIDLGLGFVPGPGTALSARDFERARREGDGLGMGLAAVGMIPVVGGVARGANALRRGGAAAAEAAPSLRASLEDAVEVVSPQRRVANERRMLREALPEGADPARYASRPTIANPARVAFPDIYMRPDELVSRARVAPEDPMMQRLFGVTRDDLFQIAEEGRRQGNMTDIPFRTAANPRGAAHAGQVMTPQNEQRLIDIISEARKRPDLFQGMASWYTMDPLYQQMVRLHGPEKGLAEFSRINALTGMASPNSEVLTEINRGTGAYMMDTAGRFGDFQRYGGIAESKRGADFPEDMRAIQGHMVHSTAQAGPMEKYLRAGQIDMDSPKVPTYIHSSGVPDTGFQTQYPVGDAHWSRLVGLPDVRGLKRDKKTGNMVPNAASASTPEMVSLGPWWRDRVAGRAELESVPAQAVVWGAGSNATGVTSPIGAPKLELLSQQIAKAADRMGVSPEQARDMILTGKAHAGFADPLLLGGLALGAGGTAAAIQALRSRAKPEEEEQTQ